MRIIVFGALNWFAVAVWPVDETASGVAAPKAPCDPCTPNFRYQRPGLSIPKRRIKPLEKGENRQPWAALPTDQLKNRQEI
jgi:hypothetical protein